VKYTKDEALKEITRRGTVLRKRRDQKITLVLSTSMILSCVALFATIGVFSGNAVDGTETVYGSFVLSAEAGGYVLAAVSGFVLGVLATLLIRHFKGEKK